MKIKGKKGQIFLITILVIALSFITIYSYIKPICFISVEDHYTSTQELENAITSIKERNLWLDEYWWNFSWDYRTQANITKTNGIINPIEIQVTLPAAHISNCTKEIRITDLNNTEINSNISYDNPPTCNISFQASFTGNLSQYYIYYGYASATVPAYRTSGLGNSENITTSYLAEEDFPNNLCSHLTDFYNKRFIKIICNNTIIEQDSKQYLNYSLYLKSQEIEFNGSIY